MNISETLPQGGNAAGSVQPAHPLVVEELGNQLASPLKNMSIGAVACWYRVEDATLAHVIARELGTDVLYAFDSEGLLSLVEGIAPGASVALVIVELLHTNDLSGLSGVVKASGGQIVAVATAQSGVELNGTAAEGALVIDPGRE